MQETENEIKAENARLTTELEKKRKDAEQARIYKGECDRLMEQV